MNEKVFTAIAKSLREFGYPDVTAKMISEIHAEWESGKIGSDLPHGIIGMFAESQLQEAADMGLLKKPA